MPEWGFLLVLYGYHSCKMHRYWTMVWDGQISASLCAATLGWEHEKPVILWCLQESLANAKVNARQHCVSLSCLCNSLTQIEWVVQRCCLQKHVKSCEIPREFDLTAVHGHPRSSILVSMESPYVTSY